MSARLCYSCFCTFEDTEGGEEVWCPHCGHKLTFKPKEPVFLAPGTILANRYYLGESLGAGGFGIVYQAYDMKLNTVVAVKEFFVARLTSRAEGTKDIIITQKSIPEFEYRKRRFLAEARTMALFGAHRNIPNVFEFFEENKTAYIVMELLKGVTLDRYIKQLKGPFDTDFAVMIANEVGNALKALHQKGIIHRDVAPDNIFICSGTETRIKLMDLGAAYLPEEKEDVIDIILKPGYSPVEQYESGEEVGSWTDIYALGATLYMMLTRTKPDESTNRKIHDEVVSPEFLNGQISENLANSVMKAMAIEPHMRFRTIDEFMKAINGEKKVIPLAIERRRRRFKRGAGILAACTVLALTGLFVMNRLNEKKKEASLEPAELSIWFSAAEDSQEAEAMESVRTHFEESFPGVVLNVEAVPEAEYADRLQEAAQKGELPNLFESTGLPGEVLENAEDLTRVLASEQFTNTLFANEYRNYYAEEKQVPLAFEVPLAFVITNGPVCVSYDADTVKDIAELKKNQDSDWSFACDPEDLELMQANVGEFACCDTEEFLNNTENTSPVMLGTTMDLNRFREVLTAYNKKCVYFDGDKTYCRFTYEWSIGKGTEEQIRASETLLSWMLGNVYQSYLMVTVSSDGQLPLNPICFETKTESQYLMKIRELKDRFVFGEEH